MGDKVAGVIEAVEDRQQTDFDGKLLEWDDGRPRMITVITLQTDDREGDNDDGKRSLWAKGGNFEPLEGEGKSMLSAIVDAVDNAGYPRDAELVGARLQVAFTGYGKPTRSGLSKPKLYLAKFDPPVRASADALFDD